MAFDHHAQRHPVINSRGRLLPTVRLINVRLTYMATGSWQRSFSLHGKSNRQDVCLFCKPVTGYLSLCVVARPDTFNNCLELAVHVESSSSISDISIYTKG